MTATAAAHEIIDAQQALTKTVRILEGVAAECAPKGRCQLKVFAVLSNVQVAIADVEELAHTAAMGDFR
jgi:hypothetical protein